METLDFREWMDGGLARQAFMQSLHRVCKRDGFFYLKNHGIVPTLFRDLLAASAAAFDLPTIEKNAVHIKHSSNFRGYSILKNDRDWREQYHFGWEWQEFEPTANLPSYYQLAGTNQFPKSLGNPFKFDLMAYMQAVNELGNQLLMALASSLGLPNGTFLSTSEEPNYLLMKLICYYPQPNGGQRPGVAAHCDWSWLTILLQDDVGGLEILSEEGKWLPVHPKEGCLSVNLGELMEITTKGYYKASPHRVINSSNSKRRISVPVFINPPLNAIVGPINVDRTEVHRYYPEHVHRVVETGSLLSPFVFGESEWQRKGLGKWCYHPACLGD